MAGLFVNRDHWSDEQLLEDYRQKKQSSSLGTLYNRYMHLVYGLCLKYLKSRERSQDAVMDVYEILANKLHESEVKHFKSWLYVVTKNHCLMNLRKEEKIPSAEIMEIPDQMHHNDAIELEADLIALENCISKLKLDQKRCVDLFFLKEKSYQEISDSYNLPLKKVKSHIQNGKRNLKICLEENHVRE